MTGIKTKLQGHKDEGPLSPYGPVFICVLTHFNTNFPSIRILLRLIDERQQQFTMYKPTEHSAMCKIVEENLDYLVRFTFFRVGDRTVAEDIVHEAVIKLFERKPDVAPAGIRMYLFRCVYNLTIDYQRRGSSHLQIDTLDFADETEEALDREEAARITRILSHLPTKEADIIMMRVVDQLSFVEIGSILDMNVSTVKSRYQSGMMKLRSEYFNNKP